MRIGITYISGHVGFTLVLWSVLLAVLPVVMMLSFALNQADQQAHRQVIAQLESVASIKANQVKRWLDDQGTILNLLLTDSDKYVDVIRLLQGDGQSEYVSELLEEHLQGQRTFTEFFLYNTNGQVLASTSPVQRGKVVTGQPYFAASLAGDHIQPPFYEISTSDLNMMLSRPIRDHNDTIIGVLAGRLKLEELSQIMTERVGLGDSGETYLVSLESNYLVTASRFEGYPLTRAYHSYGINEALDGRNGTGIYMDYRAIQTIGVYRWLPELQSALLAEMDESEALATLYQVRDVSMATAMVIALVALGIGLLITLRLTRPIVALTRAANQIAAGSYDVRVPVVRHDEIGQLGNAFNSMTQKLTYTIDELKHVNLELTIATAQAQEALHAKDAFLAVMSHELRTPLNAIIGFTEIIEMSSDVDKRTRHMVQRIKANSDRLVTLVTNVLDITRIASGKFQLAHEAFDLRELIADLSGQMEILAQKKGLEFIVKIDKSVPGEIICSREALTKIIANLLSNAFKFTHQGEVRLQIYRQGEHLELQVSDTGIGIPPDMHQAVFETFRQVDDSAIKRAYEGSGLGLAIVKQLCDALGGQIRLTSAVEQGSTFTIHLALEAHSTRKVAIYELS